MELCFYNEWLAYLLQDFTREVSYASPLLQAFDMSKDHKPDLVVERERIVNAGGFIVVGRVNGTLNLSRAIGTWIFFHSWFQDKEASKGKFTCSMPITSYAVNFFVAGDAELKQNKKLPAEQQIVTANPDIRTVSSVAADLPSPWFFLSCFFWEHALVVKWPHMG